MSPQHYYRDPEGQCQRPYFGGTFSSSSGRPSPSPCSTPTPPPYSRTTRNMSPIKSTIPSQVSFFFLWGWFYYFLEFLFTLVCVNEFLHQNLLLLKKKLTHWDVISPSVQTYVHTSSHKSYTITPNHNKNHNKNFLLKVFFFNNYIFIVLVEIKLRMLICFHPYIVWNLVIPLSWFWIQKFFILKIY